MTTPLWLALPLAIVAGEPVQRVLVELDDPAVLATVGARPVGPAVGGIVVAEVPAWRREALGDLPGVHATTCRPRQGCGTRLHPVLDRSLAAADVPALRAALGPAGGGAGVVVGVVDTGVDPTHPDLLDADGRTRVAWLADLGEAPRGVHPELEALVDGAVYGPEDLQAAVSAGDPSLVGGRDLLGHGTHMASIAAGARGVAPAATLVVVKASREQEGTFEDADVVLATRFVFAVADALGAPAVVNLSLGGDDGGHDGTSLLERGLVASLDERPAGRVLVAAAGNGAYRDAHAVAVLEPARAEERVAFVVPRPAADDGPTHVRLGAWTTGTLQVALVPPEGAEPRGASVQPGAAAGELAVLLDGVAPGRWTLVLTGSGRADLWLAETDLVGPLGTAPRFADHVDPGGQVTLPATAEAIVAVGAFATRTEWRDASGLSHHTPTATEGDVSVFSGRGPTRDGRPKPDLVAPGEAIIAALAAEADPDRPDSAFHVPGTPAGAIIDEAHAVLWGTSAASAHVAGVAALLLAGEPTLDATRLRAALCASAVPREARAWSVAYGWGVLEASRALAVLRADEADVEPAADPEASLLSVVPDVAAPGDTVRVLLSLRATDGAPVAGPLPAAVELRVQGTEPALPLRDLGGGRAEGTWTAPGDALGRAVVFEASSGGVPMPPTAVVEVAWRRDDLGGRARIAGGGCSTASGPTAPVPGLLLAGLLLAGTRPRARRPAAGRPAQPI